MTDDRTAGAFHIDPPQGEREIREREIKRIMTASLHRFNHTECAKEYIKLYEKMLDRPLVKRQTV